MADARKVARLLGGQRVLERRIQTEMDLHQVLQRGLSLQSLQFFIGQRQHMPPDVVVAFVLRRRRKAHPWMPVRLGAYQTDRLFVLADAFASAAEALNSSTRAETWLLTPMRSREASGRRPIDLLSTPIGERLVAAEIATL